MTNSKSIRKVVRESTNQDISRCLGCSDCDIAHADQDIPLGSLVQLALMDDEEALLSRTLWSDPVLAASHGACQRGLDIHKIMISLRQEAIRRGLHA